MTHMPVSAAHVSDAEIDSYWRGSLTSADEDRFEQHFLECADCLARVEAVEALIEGLRSPPPMPAAVGPRTGMDAVRRWQAIAAVLAIAAAGSAWELTRARRAVPSVVASALAGDVRFARVALAPPTRGAELQELTLPADASIVVFDLDAAEAGLPGSRFDIVLTGADARALLRLEGQPSSAAAIVRVAVDRSMLTPGRFAFELTSARGRLGLPFLIR